MAINSKWNIDEVIGNLPKEEQMIVKRLRAIILDCLPTATEKNMYGIPFYSHHRLICFIWPPSIYLGSKKPTVRKEGVTLGFQYGNLMSNEEGLLLKENRKQVYCMYFRSVKEIQDEQIRPLLYEAELVDEGFGKKKRTKKN